MTHRLTTNCAKNYCNRTLIVKVIVENVVTCFLGTQCRPSYWLARLLLSWFVSNRDPIGKCLRRDARRLVTSSMASRDSLWRHTRDVTIFKIVTFGN